jgi:hypothetical protein
MLGYGTQYRILILLSNIQVGKRPRVSAHHKDEAIVKTLTSKFYEQEEKRD